MAFRDLSEASRLFRSRRSYSHSDSPWCAVLFPEWRPLLSNYARSGLPSDKQSVRTDAVSAAFASQYEEYQYCFVAFLVEHLIVVGRAFNGDLQAVLVLAVIVQARVRAERRADIAGLDPHGIPAPTKKARMPRGSPMSRAFRGRRCGANLPHWTRKAESNAMRLVLTALWLRRVSRLPGATCPMLTGEPCCECHGCL